MENNLQYEDTRYPIGPYQKKDSYTEAEFELLIQQIEQAPKKFKDIVSFVTTSGLSKTYRDGSWNVQQLVHHVADIQMVHFFRMKKAITEDDYTEITLISMDEWVKTPDSLIAPVADSLIMLDGITKRYAYLIRSLSAEQLQRAYYHPVRKMTINQYQAVAMSAWHLTHHFAHIEIALSHS